MDVVRVAGPDRFETALAVAAELVRGAGADTIVMGSGDDNHVVDTLAAAGPAAALGLPLLLVPPTGATKTLVDGLAALRPSHVVMVGGSQAVPDTLAVGLPPFTRIGGATRYETAALVAEYFMPALLAARTELPPAIVASGVPGHLVDAMTAGQLRSVVLLAPGDSLEPVTAAWLRAHALDVSRVVVAGGTASLSDGVVTAVGQALSSW
jgi:putative cell wall-binding protein